MFTDKSVGGMQSCLLSYLHVGGGKESLVLSYCHVGGRHGKLPIELLTRRLAVSKVYY